jgi:putative spermidine/putrescine transport system substrate-binding protein
MTRRLNRREFLSSSAGVGALLALAACGSSGSSGTASKQLTGQIWGGVYEEAVDDHVDALFKQASGISSTYSVTTGGQLETVQQNAGKYDLAWLIGSDSVNGYKTGVTEAIDTSKITQYKTLIPSLVAGNTVDGKLTAVPISYGVEGILWRRDKVPFTITSWKDLWRPELKGQISIQNAPSIGGLFLVYAAARVFGTGPTDFEAGWAAMEKLAPNVQYLYTISSDPLDKLANGSISAAVTFADYGVPLETKDVAVTLPKEGVPWSVQNIAVPAAAKHKDYAYDFINWILSHQGQTAWSQYVGLAPASNAADLPSGVQSKIVETAALSSNLWPINWEQLGDNITEWTTRWQSIFSS